MFFLSIFVETKTKQMIYDKTTNFAAQEITSINGGSFLDANNILWKYVNGNWIGKRSVFTFDFRSCWLENTTIENVKSWWCGKDADYLEIFVNKKG